MTFYLWCLSLFTPSLLLAMVHAINFNYFEASEDSIQIYILYIYFYNRKDFLLFCRFMPEGRGSTSKRIRVVQEITVSFFSRSHLFDLFLMICKLSWFWLVHFRDGACLFNVQWLNVRINQYSFGGQNKLVCFIYPLSQTVGISTRQRKRRFLK